MSDHLFVPIIATWVVVQLIFAASLGPVTSVTAALT